MSHICSHRIALQQRRRCYLQELGLPSTKASAKVCQDWHCSVLPAVPARYRRGPLERSFLGELLTKGPAYVYSWTNLYAEPFHRERTLVSVTIDRLGLCIFHDNSLLSHIVLLRHPDLDDVFDKKKIPKYRYEAATFQPGLVSSPISDNSHATAQGEPLRSHLEEKSREKQRRPQPSIPTCRFIGIVAGEPGTTPARFCPCISNHCSQDESMNPGRRIIPGAHRFVWSLAMNLDTHSAPCRLSPVRCPLPQAFRWATPGTSITWLLSFLRECTDRATGCRCPEPALGGWPCRPPDRMPPWMSCDLQEGRWWLRVCVSRCKRSRSVTVMKVETACITSQSQRIVAGYTTRPCHSGCTLP